MIKFKYKRIHVPTKLYWFDYGFATNEDSMYNIIRNLNLQNPKIWKYELLK